MPMPALSPTMEVGSVARWSVKVGDKFEAGQTLAEIETDKATVSLDATDEGFIAKILVGKGEIKVGAPLLVTVEEEAHISAFENYVVDAVAAPAPVAAAAPAPVAATAVVATVAAAAPVAAPAAAAAKPLPATSGF